MRPLETGCGSLKDGAGTVCEEEAGRDLDQDPQGRTHGVGLVLLLGTDCRRCWEFARSGRIPAPSSMARC